MCFVFGYVCELFSELVGIQQIPFLVQFVLYV